MSSIDAWFFNDLSLKYLATVKTVRVLWRQWRRTRGVEKFIANVFQERDISKLSPRMLVHLVTREFNSVVDKLVLPTTVKNDLGLFFWLMLQSVFVKWNHRQWVTENEIKENMIGTVSSFMQTIDWNYIGQFDRKEMLELSVSNRKTIGYSTWSLLCYSFSEYYIRKFADTVDWKESKLWMDTHIFWYYTIYGTFPTEDMFASSQNFIEFQKKRRAGMYEKNSMIFTLFRDSIIGRSLPTVKFVCSKLTDAKKLKLLSIRDIFNIARGDVAVYLLSQIKFNYSSTELKGCGPWRDLLGWPWVLFIDSWIDKCEDMDGDQFVAIFTALKKQRREEQLAEVEGFTKRQIFDYLHAKYYVPCEKLWTLCYKKFSLLHESVFKIVSIIFNSEDFILCKIVMKGSMSLWRQESLVNILGCKILPLCMWNREFCDKFMEEILMNIEERKLLQELVDEAFGQRQAELAQML